MSAFLLSVHVLAAILAIGPVAIAASMFPRSARLALASPRDGRRVAEVRILHRITRVYSVIGVLVPVFGVATGASIGVLGDAWLIISMLLTAAAAVVLIAAILPGQKIVVAALADEAEPEAAPEKPVDSQRHTGATVTVGTTPRADPARVARRLAMYTGVFNVLWAVVVVLMIYRPGSTTGVGL
ncbi:hypothetical protein GCM10011490_10870 [Pseudoclavibacter endophyticus]|uniref:DUF2269 family protein n=1 Tax=Pseudoclavibacter endophyticus TaxID=1778590 RepID=A0A6H9WJW2_9MICO|nr:hypothetical protein [Pseudoclavibacter endophyticus]KAB1649483.1 hypothetical protein F8O04_04265 [Pseudoclavibacter endophyticus]GGA62270.1 hypothetical protein GCM10011490_10870 [Pseudoclavibacter endophyticus]